MAIIKTIVFDIGNVVWNYEAPLASFRQNHASLLGLKYQDYLSRYQQVYVEMELGRCQITDWSAQINPSVSASEVNRCLRSSLPYSYVEKYLNFEVISLLKRLRSHYPLIILSNCENYLYPYVHRHFEKHFHHSILSWRVGLRKPDPRIYQLVFNYVPCLPSEVVFIDDKPENVAGAASVGFHTILFTSSSQLALDLSHYDPSF